MFQRNVNNKNFANINLSLKEKSTMLNIYLYALKILSKF